MKSVDSTSACPRGGQRPCASAAADSSCRSLVADVGRLLAQARGGGVVAHRGGVLELGHLVLSTHLHVLGRGRHRARGLEPLLVLHPGPDAAVDADDEEEERQRGPGAHEHPHGARARPGKAPAEAEAGGAEGDVAVRPGPRGGELGPVAAEERLREAERPGSERLEELVEREREGQGAAHDEHQARVPGAGAQVEEAGHLAGAAHAADQEPQAEEGAREELRGVLQAAGVHALPAQGDEDAAAEDQQQQSGGRECGGQLPGRRVVLHGGVRREHAGGAREGRGRDREEHEVRHAEPGAEAEAREACEPVAGGAAVAERRAEADEEASEAHADPELGLAVGREGGLQAEVAGERTNHPGQQQAQEEEDPARRGALRQDASRSGRDAQDVAREGGLVHDAEAQQGAARGRRRRVEEVGDAELHAARHVAEGMPDGIDGNRDDRQSVLQTA
mmetsp:Transcript_13324/g.28812  ORF Transcript_13324/g.28812 Transcript_13324/m.28812 type:complete len:449 (-) Transcript_13324:23-1369(-)